MDNDYNLLGVVRVLVRWKTQIIIATVAATILAAAYSWIFMEDYYKSYATIYPINMAFNDRAAIFNMDKVDYFGGKDDINRVLTIAQSAPVAQYIISKYNLADHYKIDKTKKYWRTKVQKEYNDNYKALKTDQNAIEMSIYDTDPKIAADIISDVINFTDSTYRNLEIGSKKQQLETFKKQIIIKQLRVEDYGDTLAILEKMYNIKVKSGSDRTDIVEGSDNKAVQLYKTLNAKQKNAISELNYSTNIKEQIENSLGNESNSLAVIDAPIISDKKEKPVRSLICITTMLLTLVFSIFAALLFDQIEVIRKQL
jgi:uncharacterized protein involved in exopolysaccharide biosynthesis